MAKPKTDKDKPNLTSGTPIEEPTESGTPSAGLGTIESDEEELDFKTKAGFQTALQKSREAEKASSKELREKVKEATKLRQQLKAKDLKDLSAADRLEKEASELAEENARLKLQNFVAKEVQKRELDLNDPLVEIVMDTPWSIPPVRRILGDSPTWEEVIESVEDKLPSYLDSLVARRKEMGKVQETTPSTEPASEEDETTPVVPPSTTPTSTERTVPAANPKRVWTRTEILALSDENYLKHSKEIKQALADGRIIER